MKILFQDFGVFDLVNKSIILVADDDMAVLDTTTILLELFGYEVIQAHDGFDVISKYKQYSPALVFLDVKMPKMNGYETFFRIINFDPTAKVIFMTAHADYTKWNEAKKKNAIQIIEKPYSAELLKELVQKHCPLT